MRRVSLMPLMMAIEIIVVAIHCKSEGTRLRTLYAMFLYFKSVSRRIATFRLDSWMDVVPITTVNVC
jgi:hypothetical protein